MFYIVKLDEETGLFDLVRVMGTVMDRIGRYTDPDRAEQQRVIETLKLDRRDDLHWD